MQKCAETPQKNKGGQTGHQKNLERQTMIDMKEIRKFEKERQTREARLIFNIL